MLRFALLLPLLAACPSGEEEPGTPDAGEQPDDPDAAPRPDAMPPRVGFGEVCETGNDCLSGLCIGDDQSDRQCSRLCSLQVAHDCKDVDAFCVPVGDGDFGCWGEIETGADQDDAIVEVGDSVTRAVTPLSDADLFQVRLNELGDILFQVTPEPSIDVKIEAYGVLGDPLGFANDAGPGGVEALGTEVQQIGGHIFIVVRNVGSATGGYTLAVTEEE
jgi:hypothetical protein